MGSQQQEGEDDQDDGTNLGYLDEITAEVINDGSIHVVAEYDIVLLRDGERGLVEGDSIEGIIYILL